MTRRERSEVGNFAFLFLEALLEEESVSERAMGGIVKNRSHLSYLNRIFKEFVEARVVEGQ